MEKRIEEEVAGRPIEEVVELILDDCACTHLTELTDVYVNLEKLSLSGCGLTTLKGFPNLPNLRKLDLSNNKLTDTELAYLVSCPALTHLSLGGNSIKDIASLEPLKALKTLRKLDMPNCGASDADDYREKVFELLDQIIFLDGLDREEQDDDDDSDDDVDDGLDAEEDEDGEGASDDDENSDGEGSDDLGPGGEDDDDDDDDDGEGDEEEQERGTKRKHEDEEDV